MARRPLPSFSRILLDPSAPHLQLPHPFVQKHLENKIPENPILRSVNGGYAWRLKIEKVDENYCFADGWNNVVEDSNLEFGDFLVFWLIDHSTFKLSIFSPSGCGKDFPVEIDEEEEEVEIIEDEDVEIIENKEDEEEAEEDDEEDDEFQEDEDEEVASEEDEDESDDGGGGGFDEEEDDDGGADIDGDDGDPFFRAVMSKGHSRSLRLPAEFTRLAGIDSARSITMKNMNGNEWTMNLLSDHRHFPGKKSDSYVGKDYTRYYLSKGWCEFMRVNDLCEGDECVFTFIRSEDMLCLAKVTKKRVHAKPPAGKAPVVAQVKERTSVPQRNVEVESKDDGREAVKKNVRSEPPAGKAQADEVLKRLRGRPPREEVVEKKARSTNAGGKAPVTEVLKRPRGRPPRVEKKVRSKKPAEEVPAAEVSKRPRGRPSRVEVVEKKGRGKKPAGDAPAAGVLTRKRRGPSRVDMESKDEGTKGSRGRPFKRKRGQLAAHTK